MTAGRLTQITGRGYTDSAPEKDGDRIGVLNLKADNRHQRGFFMSVCLLLWADCTGCSNARRDLESGTPTCTALPTPIGVEVASGKTISRRHNMSNQSIATSVAPVIDIPFLKIPRFPAAITSEQIDTIEKTLAEHHRTRRLMLLFLSYDSETFIEKAKAIIDGDEDIYMEAIEALDDYQKKLKSLSELANSALARFLCVGEYVSRKGA